MYSVLCVNVLSGIFVFWWIFLIFLIDNFFVNIIWDMFSFWVIFMYLVLVSVICVEVCIFNLGVILWINWVSFKFCMRIVLIFVLWRVFIILIVFVNLLMNVNVLSVM